MLTNQENGVRILNVPSEKSLNTIYFVTKIKSKKSFLKKFKKHVDELEKWW